MNEFNNISEYILPYLHKIVLLFSIFPITFFQYIDYAHYAVIFTVSFYCQFHANNKNNISTTVIKLHLEAVYLSVSVCLSLYVFPSRSLSFCLYVHMQEPSSSGCGSFTLIRFCFYFYFSSPSIPPFVHLLLLCLHTFFFNPFSHMLSPIITIIIIISCHLST